MASPSRRLPDVFENFGRIDRARLIAEDRQRALIAGRLDLDPSEGHGQWEMYRLAPALYVVSGDFVYDQPRRERLPGEELVEFHLRISGSLHLESPGRRAPLKVGPASLLIWRQQPGQEVFDCVSAKHRDTSVSIFCGLDYLRAMTDRIGVIEPNWFDGSDADGAFMKHRVMGLNSSLVCLTWDLLRNPYSGGLRLLYTEAKVLEVLCEIFRLMAAHPMQQSRARDDELRRLDAARHIITTQFNPPPHIAEVARRVGMSESKLKRAFKERFGSTLFEVSLESRMRHAMELLRSGRSSVGEIAFAVGYNHQTSFTAAFRQHYRLLPKDVQP